MIIRDATPADIPAITAIYNEAVPTPAIWNDELVDEGNRLAWLTAKQDGGFPVLVADDNGVVGYASYGPFRPFDGYRYTVENSIYLHSAAHGKGIGTALLSDLSERARGQNIHVMVAAIESRNDVSIALHEKAGFTRVGYMPQVGHKFEGWMDLVLMQKILE